MSVSREHMSWIPSCNLEADATKLQETFESMTL